MPIIGNLSSGGKKPTTPTIGTATAGNTSATVAYTASTYTGKGGAVTYTATSSPGGFTGTGASPITVSGLTNGTAYTFTVRTTTSYGVASDNSAASNSVTPVAPKPIVTGGTLTSDATYYYRVFTSSGTLGISVAALDCSLITIAGGGGGSYLQTAGGGAGGLLYTASATLTGNQTVTIGAGGNYAGNDSSIGAYTAIKGGNPGVNAADGGNGGSGGGGAVNGGGSSGGAGTSGQGNNGGPGNNLYGGGGGGAGAAGINRYAGNGTNAYSSWLSAISSVMTGVSGWTTATSGGYITAGGASSQSNVPSLGGGGYVTSVNGVTNTGSGGGANQNTGGGNGGSGLVIVRYLKSAVN